MHSDITQNDLILEEVNFWIKILYKKRIRLLQIDLKATKCKTKQCQQLLC